MSRSGSAPEEAVTALSADWPLWGGTARVVLRPPGGLPGQERVQLLSHARHLVTTVTSGLDETASRFRPDSEVSRLATSAARSECVSALLADLLRVALRCAAQTGGAVDPTLGTALVAAGYDQDLASLPADRPQALTPIRRVSSWRDVHLDAAGRLSMPAGVLLDLGATAKAYGADQAATQVHNELSCPVLVSLCGDLTVAGTRPGQPWLVSVQERPGDDSGPTVALPDDCGVATSTTRVRAWRMAGRPAHHVLDPRTGRPTRPYWRTVTVAAASCVDANAASTATVVKARHGLDWLIGTGLDGRLVHRNGSVTVVGDWPLDDTTAVG